MGPPPPDAPASPQQVAQSKIREFNEARTAVEKAAAALAKAESNLAAMLGKLEAAKQLRRAKREEYDAVAAKRALAYAESKSALDAAASTTAGGDGVHARVVATSLDDDDGPFANVEMPDDDPAGDVGRLLLLDQRYAERKA